MKRFVLVALLLAGCAPAKPAPTACAMMVMGAQPWDTPYWVANCQGHVAGSPVRESEVWPLRFHYTPTGIQSY